MKSQIFSLYGLAVLLALVAFCVSVFLLPKRDNELPPIEELPAVVAEPLKSGDLDEHLILNKSAVGQVATREIAEVLASDDSEIQRLQDFLDENDADGILEQAAFLADSEEPARREAAIDALIWLSSPKGGKLLLPLLNDPDPDIAQQALNGLMQVLTALAVDIYDDSETGELVVSSEEGNMDETKLQETYNLWVEACVVVDDVDSLETLLIGLNGVDVKFSVPAMVDVLERTQGAFREKVAEYLDSATNGDGVTNREEAALWLMEKN